MEKRKALFSRKLAMLCYLSFYNKLTFDDENLYFNKNYQYYSIVSEYYAFVKILELLEMT